MVALWDLSTAVCVSTVYGLDNPVRSVSFSADGAHVAFAMLGSHVAPGGVEVVEAPSGAHVYSAPVLTGSEAVAWNPRHAHVLAFASDDSPRDGGMIGLLVAQPSSSGRGAR